MVLDVQTLMIGYTATVCAVAVALSVVLGWRASEAARYALGSALAQAAGWICLLASGEFPGHWLDQALSTVAMLGMSASLACLLQAARLWLGRAPWPRSVWPALLAIPLLYGLGFASYPWRVGLSNLVLAAQMVWIAAELLRGSAADADGGGGGGRRRGWRWRSLIITAMVSLAIVTLWRGVLGAFFTELYPTFRTPHPVSQVGAVLNSVMTVLVALGMLAAFREEAEAQLKALAITDGLTQVLNRRAWGERASALMADARRYGHPLIVLMIDLDRFKQINDRRGHATGDLALQLTARVLREELRSGDLVGRYGGEEFCVMLSHTREAAALAFDQRLRVKLRDCAEQELGFALEYSAGLTAHRHKDGSLDDLLRRADAALYEAKRAGRGQLVMSP